MLVRAILLLSAFSIVPRLWAQDIPQAALDAFHERHPDVSAVEWTEVEGIYRAQYMVDGILRTADLDARGHVIVEGQVKREEDLTEAERSTLGREYPGYRVTGVRSTSTAARGTFTEVMLSDGKNKVEVLLDEQGRMAAANPRK